MIRVKVCCIASAEEARTAIRLGASALGLVSEMPSGPGPIEDAEIAAIARSVPPGVATFLLTCRTEADAIVEQQRAARVNTLQLVDRVPVPVLWELRQRLPGVALVQVVHVVDRGALEEAEAVAPHVDAILLDSGNPAAEVRELGGTGRTHDWEISREIVEASTRPVYLAGGLGPDNAADAIERVRPFGIDLCSGIRSEGRLDEDALARFMDEVARAGAAARVPTE